MASTADLEIYKREWIQGYERTQTNFRATVTTDVMMEGKTAHFLVATSNREAVTRGVNGLIPANTSDYALPQVTIVEEHDLERGSRYKYFTGQADQRAIAQAQGRNVINRAVDNRIINELATGTQTLAEVTMSAGLINRATTILGNNSVPISDGQLFGAVTPAQYNYMEDLEVFSSSDYVETRPLEMGVPNMQVTPIRMKMWKGVLWFPHEGLPGIGTSAAKQMIYHRSAIGYAYSPDEVSVGIGYDEEQDYYFSRHTVFHAAKLLQNSGVIVVTCDDTGLSS